MDKLCTECGREAGRLRRDRCDACYMRLYRGGDVPEGAMCGGCGERRRDLLCVEALGGEDQVVCGNCALVLRRARPRLASMAELRRRRVRDRRGVASPPSPSAVDLGAERAAAPPRRRQSDELSDALPVALPPRPFDVSVD